MRVAVAGFMHESNTFNPLRTGRAAFAAQGRAVGPDLPVAVSLDLHGNLSQSLVENCTLAVAYRTCPHVDQRECGRRVASLLARTLRGEVRPAQALAKPPLLINIMAHDTSCEPLASFMAAARELEGRPGVLAASLLPGF